VGRAVTDMIAVRNVVFYPVSMTSVQKTTRKGGYFNVPKKDLISPAIVGFQNGWIKLAKGLPHRAQLEHELLNYRLKVNLRTGNESFEAWRDRDHDDMVFALSLAIWAAMTSIDSWRNRALPPGTYEVDDEGFSL
jgi:hypothetical protein